MPRRTLPKYVYQQTTRHGKTVFYYRREGHAVRLPSPDDPAFSQAYADASAGRPLEAPQSARGSLSALIREYRTSPAFLALSPATRRQRDNIFRNVEAISGKVPYRAITQADMIDARERRAVNTPAQARNFLDAMRGLFRWARSTGRTMVDPTEGVRNPVKSRSKDGFPAWTMADVDRYHAKWHPGTIQRQWLDVLLTTGLRRGDAVRLHSDHIDADGWFSIETEKTGVTVHGIAPPHKPGYLITGSRGQALTKETFGNFFREACREAGIEKSAHGLRKLAATKAAEAGLTVAELEALFGWTGGTMASLYTRSANRKALARQALKRLGKG